MPKKDSKNKSEKQIKISQAQQYMILAVLGASLFLGAAIAVVLKSINKISFSASVIAAQEKSITKLSDTIKDIGICKKPSGKIYSDTELNSCNPDSISASDVPGTLKSNIIENMAANTALASVPNTSNDNCINQDTGKNYTYKELEKEYSAASDSGSDERLLKASELIRTCSSLRIIPDALPADKNEEALLASIDKIFRDSGTEPEELAPTTGGDDFGDETTETRSSASNSLYIIPVNLAIESDAGTVNKFLDNAERSIRNFNIKQAKITWSGSNTIEFDVTADAYYTLPSTLTITDLTINPGDKNQTSSSTSNSSTGGE